MLEIRMIETKNKGFRVDIFRRYKSEDPQTLKPKFYYKRIDSFRPDTGYSASLISQLEPDEIVQLQNWLAETRFGESLNTPMEQLEKIALRIPPTLLTALTRLHLEATRVGLDFTPTQIMLTALWEAARKTEQSIDEKNGFVSHILASAGLPNIPDTLEEVDCAADPESHALFDALLQLKQPVGQTCSELEAVAAHFGKNKKIPPPQIREWAGDMKHRSTHKRIKKWCYTVTIEVLHQHGINPTQLMSPARVAIYWTMQHQARYSILEAPTAFIRAFDVPQTHQAAVTIAIAQIYERSQIAAFRHQAVTEPE